MAEIFLAVFEDGPYPGKYEFPENQTWPLPEFIKAKFHDKGCYVKSWESKGQAKKEEARGAKYLWDEASAGVGVE